MHTVEDSGAGVAWAVDAPLADAAAPPAVITLDRAGRIEAITPRAATWLGVSGWQVRGRHVSELGWALGDVALARIAEVARGGAGATTRVGGRRRPTVTLALARVGERLTLTLAP